MCSSDLDLAQIQWRPVSHPGTESHQQIRRFADPLAALMQAGATARAVVDVEMAHPTFAEGVQSVAMQLPRYALG